MKWEEAETVKVKMKSEQRPWSAESSGACKRSRWVSWAASRRPAGRKSAAPISAESFSMSTDSRRIPALKRSTRSVSSKLGPFQWKSDRKSTKTAALMPHNSIQIIQICMKFLSLGDEYQSDVWSKFQLYRTITCCDINFQSNRINQSFRLHNASDLSVSLKISNIQLNHKYQRDGISKLFRLWITIKHLEGNQHK